MRTSIRIKFSVFLAALLLLTVAILSLLVLEGIKKNQQAQYEQYLAQQAKTANIYLLQTILSEPNKDPDRFLAAKGPEFAKQLEQITGQLVVLFDQNGGAVSGNAPAAGLNDRKTALGYALSGKIAYQDEGDALYYMAPLRAGNAQIGVVQFYYSLSGNIAFYNRIKRLFTVIGAGVFGISFLLAYLYFNSFAGKIIMLGRMVDGIRQGHYDVRALRRRDEIGALSEGIRAMSGQIDKTIRDMREEQHKLTLAVEKLSRLEKQQREFIGSVTHEFKTPLTSIGAYLDLLEMYPEDQKLLDTARTTIKSETGRLYEMVDKVLQLSALEKYDFEFGREKIDVRQSIERVLGGLKGRMERSGIALATDLAEACIEADRDSVALMLVNLLDNAIKYNNPGGSISVRSCTDGGRVVIEIGDTGIGIPRELADKVFEPFFTVDKNRTRQTGGAGLGLSLVKRHAEAQGGSVSLIKTGPGGSTFRIVFPAYIG